jgi:hypothetical protein
MAHEFPLVAFDLLYADGKDYTGARLDTGVRRAACRSSSGPMNASESWSACSPAIPNSFNSVSMNKIGRALEE